MKTIKPSILILAIGSVIVFASCKKSETTTSSNIATEVVQNLETISANYTPDSLADNSSSSVAANASIQSSDDPCEGVTDFAVCQSNLIRAYIRVGKGAVNTLSGMAAQIGSALGEVPDGNAGTSADGKISWNKTSSDVWSVISRNDSNATVAYFSVNNGVYSLKVDANNSDDNPEDKQLEATVTYNSSSDWSVDVYFGNNECDATDVTDPSKIRVRMSKVSGLWTGKAMVYVPRWQTPGGSAPTCSTTSGTNDIAMYTEFVGNHTSTKAALLMVPSTENTTGDLTSANYSLPQFCSNFPAACGAGPGQVPPTFLNTYTNNWCTTGPGTNPTWGDDCTSNSAVSGASYSASSEWVVPSLLKVYSVTMPTSL